MLSNQGFQDYPHRAKTWFPALSSQNKNERIARCQQIMVWMTTMLAMQTYEDWAGGDKKSRFSGLYPQCTNERSAREVLTNCGCQDHTRNPKVERFHNMCSRIMVARIILSEQKWKNCNGCLDYTRNAKMRWLHKRNWQMMVSRTMLAVQEWDDCTGGVDKSWFPELYSPGKDMVCTTGVDKSWFARLSSRHTNEKIAREMVEGLLCS